MTARGTSRSTRRWLPVARLGAWVALLVAVIVAFGAVGPAPPPVLTPDAWPGWMSERSPVEMAFGVLRIVVVALAWYLLGATIVGSAARLLRAARLVQLADLMTIPPIRRLLQAALGIGLATASLSALGHAAVHSEGVAAVAAHAAERGGETPVGEELPVLRLLPGTPIPAVTAAEDIAPAASAGAESPGETETWQVEEGQHFWGIADHVLTQAWDRTPGEDEVLAYWQRLIEHNRERLADPGNPDLIFPGQVFDLPPTPPAPHS